VHINCALWSAEVYEEGDGSLQMVHLAIARGRKLVTYRFLSCLFQMKSAAVRFFLQIVSLMWKDLTAELVLSHMMKTWLGHTVRRSDNRIAKQVLQ